MRELIEGTLFYYGYLFGQYEEPLIDELLIPEHEMILVQNQKHSFGPNSNRSILHAGVIGRGLRPENMLMGERCPPEMQSLLLKALEMCCSDNVSMTMCFHCSYFFLIVTTAGPTSSYRSIFNNISASGRNGFHRRYV